MYIEGISEPIIGSRTERSILRDMIETPDENLKAQGTIELIEDLMEDLRDIGPMLRRTFVMRPAWTSIRLNGACSACSTEFQSRADQRGALDIQRSRAPVSLSTTAVPSPKRGQLTGQDSPAHSKEKLSEGAASASRRTVRARSSS